MVGAKTSVAESCIHLHRARGEGRSPPAIDFAFCLLQLQFGIGVVGPLSHFGQGGGSIPRWVEDAPGEQLDACSPSFTLSYLLGRQLTTTSSQREGHIIRVAPHTARAH